MNVNVEIESEMQSSLMVCCSLKVSTFQSKNIEFPVKTVQEDKLAHTHTCI